MKVLIERHFGVGSFMVDIARCESGLQQFNKDGTVLRGRITPKDIGLFQINEHYWLEESERIGLDIYSIDGNIKMAEHILKTQGRTAWAWSAHCHGIK